MLLTTTKMCIRDRCYSYDGEIYTVKEGQKPAKVNIQIVADKIENDVIPVSYTHLDVYKRQDLRCRIRYDR